MLQYCYKVSLLIKNILYPLNLKVLAYGTCITPYIQR